MTYVNFTAMKSNQMNVKTAHLLESIYCKLNQKFCKRFEELLANNRLNLSRHFN